MQAVINYLEDQRAEARELGQQVADRDAELDTLSQEIGRLQEELGGVADEQAYLQQRLLAQEALRQQVKQIESTFERAEAEVFRDSNEIYIRLVGLNFDVGSAAIESDNFDILRKVEDAIRVFDDSQVVIEGHTDSYGSDEENLSLSELRATSVREYLMVKMGLESERVNAVGYGETRPVANNETPQGRAKNRRIDVRIVPNTVGGVDLAQATF
jgi:outer membrane protein OmpA-like peptidoglycan-associated protein